MLRIGQCIDVPLERKRDVIDWLAEEYPVKTVCEVLDVSRSS
jgi:hypothetical protein